MAEMKRLYTDGVRDLHWHALGQGAIAEQVLEDLSKALEADRAKAYEAGKLAATDSFFEQRQEAYERGVADEQARIIKLLERIMPERIAKSEGRPVSPTVGIQETIALIKGENKTNLWTSRPLTEEDEEHYGLEGENK
jgi:hypothetical protein